MPQKLLDQIQRHTFLPQEGGNAMPEEVRVNIFINPGFLGAFMDYLLDSTRGEFCIPV
jgi:hypothetical protein